MRVHAISGLSCSLLFLAVALASSAHAQAGWVLSEQKISDTQGGFTGTLDDWDFFGTSVATLGDLDGDGVGDIAVGAQQDGDGGYARGAVWILFLNPDGTTKAHQKISDTTGGFAGILNDVDSFGSSVAALGDLDGDGICDLAVGATGDSAGGWWRGAVWILFLNTDGTVKAHQKINDATGGFGGVLDDFDNFGASLGAGDLDSDGTVELLIGVRGDDDGGADRGAVWVLFLNTNGTVRWEQKISSTEGGFQGALLDGDWFGSSVAFLGDLDLDGSVEVAVGACYQENATTTDSGGVWILTLDTGGSVLSEQLICNFSAGLGSVFRSWDIFGRSVACLADQDGDGVPDLAVGASGDDDGGTYTGAVWIVFLETDGTVKALQKINVLHGGFGGDTSTLDQFGLAMASLGDHDGDGYEDLVVGAPSHDDGGENRGAIWSLFLQGCPAASATSRNPDVGGITNPHAYTATALPRLGVGFTGSVTTTGKAGSYLVGYTTPATLSTSWGNLLVDVTDPNGELLGWPFALGDPAVITMGIPDDPILCGFECATQAVRFGGGIDLTNAQDLVLGR